MGIILAFALTIKENFVFNFILIILPVIFFVSVFMDDFEAIKSFLLAIIVIGIIFIVINWLFDLSPYGIYFEITDQGIMALFTIILAVSTLINFYFSSRNLNLSRLTYLNFKLDGIHSIRLKNIGNFSAKRIKIIVGCKRIHKEGKFLSKIWQLISEFFSPIESRIVNLFPNETVYLDPLIEKLKKKLDIKENKSVLGGLSFGSEEGKREYLLDIAINYSTDRFYISPYPLFKKYKVIIDKNGINFVDFENYDNQKP